MFIKPKARVKVRDPDTKQHLPDEGAEVMSTTFWLRRLADGDVVQTNQIHDSKEHQP